MAPKLVQESFKSTSPTVLRVAPNRVTHSAGVSVLEIVRKNGDVHHRLNDAAPSLQVAA
jgi:hypothetical protein